MKNPIKRLRSLSAMQAAIDAERQPPMAIDEDFAAAVGDALAEPLPVSRFVSRMNKARAIYLSGPMKGYKDSNYPLFNRVTAELRDLGHTVYNPAEFPHDGPNHTFPLRKAFADYCAFICNEADTIVLLTGWENSMGVSAELALAKNCGLDIIEHTDVLP